MRLIASLHGNRELVRKPQQSAGSTPNPSDKLKGEVRINGFQPSFSTASSHDIPLGQTDVALTSSQRGYLATIETQIMAWSEQSNGAEIRPILAAIAANTTVR
jgi:hypothetical protein